MRLRSIPLAAALVLPAPGCCSLARLFCGPDRTPWVSIDHATPEATVRTLLEALRRDAPEVVYGCLSNAYRDRLHLDQASVTLAWVKLREQNPGLHVAGYAEVPPATRIDADHARIELCIEGQRLEVDVVRQLYWEVRYRRDNGTPGASGQPLGSLADRASIVADDTADRSTLTLSPLTFRHDGLEAVPLTAIEFAGIQREWKVDRLTMLTDS